MAWCTSERAEAVRRVIFVVIRQRIPLGIEVFVNAIMIISGDVVDNHGSHANRAIQPFFVVSDVINNQESFHRVHIGIAAAVLFGFAEGFVPGLQAHLLFFAPEVFLNNFNGVIEKFTRFRVTGSDGAGSTQQSKEVLIALFGGIHHALVIHAGIPTAIFFIAQCAVHGFDTVINQRVSARSTHRRSNGINVQHTSGDPQMGAHLFFDLPFIA